MQCAVHSADMNFPSNNESQNQYLPFSQPQYHALPQFSTTQYQQIPLNPQQPTNFPHFNQSANSSQYINNQSQINQENVPNSITMQRSISNDSMMYEENEESEPSHEAQPTHEWQVVKKRKRNTAKTASKNIDLTIQTGNRFEPLINPTVNIQTTEPKTPNPPPIFIYGVRDFNKMTDNLSQITEEETYQCKALQNDTIKINTKDPEVYKKLVRHLNSEKIIHHTYQMSQDRAYRIVIRNLHYSIPVENIKVELENKGHTVRNILNIRHRVSKHPLMMFYVDLEPKPNNKDVFKIEFLNNMKIIIEPPHKKKGIIQCTRCQLYGHSKSYCTRPYSCVKCGGDHNSTDCNKPRDTPPKCVLCSDHHTANYKGCVVYRDLQNKRNKNTFTNQQFQPNNTQLPNIHNIHRTNITNRSTDNKLNESYSNVVRGDHTKDTFDLGAQLNVFLNEFKSMFMQLINQNSMILNMLSTVISNKSNGH